ISMEQRKVFVVTAGWYSDYRILGIFAEESVAQRVADEFNQRRPADDAQVEVYPLLDDVPPPVTMYRVWVDTDGNEVRRDIKVVMFGDYDYEEGERSSRTASKGAFGQSPRGFDVALKIARDRLYQEKARRAGLG